MYKHPSYKFLSFLRHSGIPVMERYGMPRSSQAAMQHLHLLLTLSSTMHHVHSSLYPLPNVVMNQLELAIL